MIVNDMRRIMMSDEEYPTNNIDDIYNESVSIQVDEENKIKQDRLTNPPDLGECQSHQLSCLCHNIIPAKGYQYIEYTYNSAKAFAIYLNHMMDDPKQYFSICPDI
jgi:hypothetical protein